MQYLRFWARLSPSTQQRLIRLASVRTVKPRRHGVGEKSWFSGTTLLRQHNPTTNFDIYYSTVDSGVGGDGVLTGDSVSWALVAEPVAGIVEGENPGSNGVPDFIDQVAYSLERAFQDFSFAGMLVPDQRIDVTIEAGAGPGFTLPLAANIHMSPPPHPDSPDGPGERFPMHTARHELFHVFQYEFLDFELLGDFDRNMWWLEASAQWASHHARDPLAPGYENEVTAFDVVDFLEDPSYTLMTSNQYLARDHAYDSFLFVEFVEEKCGTSFVSRVLYLMRFNNWGADEAIESALLDCGSTLTDVIVDFGVANYVLASDNDPLGTYNAPSHYESADVDLWRGVLAGSALTGEDYIPWGRPKRHPVILGQPGSVVTDSAVAGPGGSVYVDFRLGSAFASESGGVNISIHELDGVSPADYDIRLLPFASAYPAMCAPPTEGSEFDIVLSPGCPVATVVMTHNKPRAAQGEDAQFRWTATFSRTAYELDVLDDNPAGYWRLNEATTVLTQATDASGDEHHGTFGGGISMLKKGAIDKDPDTAAGFAYGSDAGVSLPTAPLGTSSFGQVTAEGWARTTSQNAGSPYVKTIVGQPGTFALGHKGNKAFASVRVGGVDEVVTGTDDVNEGGWHHLAMTYDGSVLRLFVDGEPVDEEPASGQIQPSPYYPMRIGAQQSNTTYFDGHIDEVAVYDHVLEPAIFQERFAYGWKLKPPCPAGSPYVDLVCSSNPVAYWRLGESVGDTDMHDYTDVNDGIYPDPQYPSGVMKLGHPAGIKDDPNTSVRVGDVSPKVNYEPYGTLAVDHITAEGWVRTVESSAGATLSIISRSNSFNLGLKDNKAYGRVTIGGVPHEVTGGPLLNDGRWHHVALTYDGSMMTLYADGVAGEGATKAVSGPIDNLAQQELYVGSLGGSTATRFRGELDEVALYDHALNETAILARTSQHAIAPVTSTSTWEPGVDMFQCADGSWAPLANPDLYVVAGGLLHMDVKPSCTIGNQGSVEWRVYTVNGDGTRGTHIATSAITWWSLPYHWATHLDYADLYQPLWVEIVGKGACCSTRHYGIAKTNL
jgi:hypothetical protein